MVTKVKIVEEGNGWFWFVIGCLGLWLFGQVVKVLLIVAAIGLALFVGFWVLRLIWFVFSASRPPKPVPHHPDQIAPQTDAADS